MSVLSLICFQDKIDVLRGLESVLHGGEGYFMNRIQNYHITLGLGFYKTPVEVRDSEAYALFNFMINLPLLVSMAK